MIIGAPDMATAVVDGITCDVTDWHVVGPDRHPANPTLGYWWAEVVTRDETLPPTASPVSVTIHSGSRTIIGTAVAVNITALTDKRCRLRLEGQGEPTIRVALVAPVSGEEALRQVAAASRHISDAMAELAAHPQRYLTTVDNRVVDLEAELNQVRYQLHEAGDNLKLAEDRVEELEAEVERVRGLGLSIIADKDEEIEMLIAQRNAVLALCDKADRPCLADTTGICTHGDNVPLDATAIRAIYAGGAT